RSSSSWKPSTSASDGGFGIGPPWNRTATVARVTASRVGTYGRPADVSIHFLSDQTAFCRTSSRGPRVASARRRGGRDAAPAPARPTGTRASLGRPRTGESARSLLNTVLGEFVYPVGGAAGTHSFIEALGRLDVDEKATRQALARTAADGWLERERHGRRIRWRLSPQGLQRCIDGTVRIESFGGVRTDWDGRWLLLFVSVPEAQRALGHRLRRRITWAGFG